MNLFRRRKLKPEHHEELLLLHRMVEAEKLKATMIKRNSGFVPDGVKLAEQGEAVVNLLLQVQNSRVGAILASYGYKPHEEVLLDVLSGRMKVANIIDPDAPPEKEVEKNKDKDAKST